MKDGKGGKRNLVAIQGLHKIRPEALAELLSEFLALCGQRGSYLCLPSTKVGELIKKYYSEEYKVRSDLVRLGVLQPVEIKERNGCEKPLDIIEWCSRKVSKHEYLCVSIDEYQCLRSLIEKLRINRNYAEVLAYAYKVKRNKPFILWLDELYARENTPLKKAYELLWEIIASEVGEKSTRQLMPSSPSRFREVLVEPLSKLSNNIISLKKDVITVNTYEYYKLFRKSSKVKAKEALTLQEFIRGYIEYLCKKGWEKDWLRWGTHSVNLYDLWLNKFSDRVPWKEFLDIVKRLASSTYGISYTHYFIYGEERAHSVSVLVDTARLKLGSEFERILKRR